MYITILQLILIIVTSVSLGIVIFFIRNYNGILNVDTTSNEDRDLYRIDINELDMIRRRKILILIINDKEIITSQE